MDGDPVLRGPIVMSPSTFSFYCDILYTPAPTSEIPRFEVTFMFDGIEIADGEPLNETYADQYELLSIETDINNPTLSVELEDFYLTGRLGKQVREDIGIRTNSWRIPCFTSLT